MRAAILSDTHGLLRPAAVEILESCDVIIHGGDINSEKILDRMQAIAPLYVVRGNNDKEWASGMQKELYFELEGVSFYLIHNKKEASERAEDADVVIYGHSHRYMEEKKGETLWLNPGSCGPRRFGQPITMAVMTIDRGCYAVEKLEFSQE